MYVLLVGINHRTAPVEIREKLAFSDGTISQAYEYLRQKENLEGAVILHTCNRTEVYATARDIELGREALKQFMELFSQLSGQEMQEYLYQPNCYDAILNLFRVASGLDSMILGESQILGQVKEAYKTAREENASDGVLNTLFQQAINVGKKVRSETDIDRYPISVSSVAVELARSQLGTLQDKSVVVIGAGEMSELTTRYLMEYGVSSVIVSNRSYAKAETMARLFSGRAVRFDRLPAQLSQADIVISCTSASHYVLNWQNSSEILKARQGRRIIIIDIEEDKAAEISLIENLQRDDLTPVEEARAYKMMMDRYNYTQETLAQRIGKSRSHVANMLRILALPEEVLKLLEEGKLSAGHARALLAIGKAGEQIQMAQAVAEDRVSVRQLEKKVKNIRSGDHSKGKPRLEKLPEVKDLEERLQLCLGTRAQVSAGNKGGKIIIEYYSLDDLERICDIIGI
jgi:glutamyl-tRNA reductase